MLRFLFRSNGNEEKERKEEKPRSSAERPASSAVETNVSGASPTPPSAATVLGSGPMAKTAAAALSKGAANATEKPVPTPSPTPPATVSELVRASEAPKAMPSPTDRLGEVTLFKNLLSGLYDAVLIFDSKGFLIAHNPRAEQYFGFSAQELWGMRCAELVEGIDERVLFKIRSATAGGKFTVITGKGRRRDGTTFPAEIAISQARILNEGDLLFAVHSLERQEKVREKQQQIEAAVHGAMAALVVCEADGVISYANPAFLRMVRLTGTPDQVRRPIGEFVSPSEAVSALLNPPPPPGAWMGRVQVQAAGGPGISVLASSARYESEKGVHWVVLSLFPLPVLSVGS